MSTTAPAPLTTTSSAVVALRERLQGAAHTPDDPGYLDARASWNLVFDARPAVVVEAASAQDVVEAVRFAVAADLGVAVQATGHGMAGVPGDDAVLISARKLDSFSVDPDTRTARIEAGVLWGPVLAEAQRHGLAPLLGSSPGVGAVGYTLGGGLGWLARKHGLSADTVRAAEVVTADGQLRRLTVEDIGDDAELLWALRGGGAGSLGVVTALELELVEVAEVYAGNLLYPVEDAEEVFARYRDWVRDAPDELTSAVLVMHYPPLEIVPEPVRGRSFAIVRGCWAGPLEEGAALVDQLRAWRTPELDLFGPMPFSEAAAISQDPVDPLPALATTDSLGDLDPQVTRVLLDHTLADGGPPPLMFTEVRHGGGALTRPGRGAGHQRLRDVAFVTHVIGVPDPDDPGRLAGHLADLGRALAPHRAEHTYLNFVDAEDRRERTREAFTDDEWTRLQAVKAAVDPDGRFRYGLAL